MTTVDAAIDALRRASSILVFTGAGISTESGIPDFRGPDGVWTKVDPAEFTIDRYLTRRETRIASWANRRDSGVLDAEPNDGHRAVVSLWEAGLVAGCVTQNIDGLHQAAGLPSGVLAELHGNVSVTVCVDCGQRTPTPAILERVSGGDADPHCEDCGGILKVNVVFFGEQMPLAEMARAWEFAEAADAVLVIGSTLSVFPAAQIPLDVAHAGYPLVIVNQGDTEFDGIATVKLDTAAGPAVTAIVNALC